MPPAPALQSLKTRPFERDLAMTRVGIAVGTRLAGHTLRNLFRDRASRDAASRDFYREQGLALARQLGELKGGLMKAGQLIGLYGEYVLPPEAVESLQSLQDHSPPVAWPVMLRQLERQLGKARVASLEIDEQPIGAASLGQVHRARRRADGAGLCLKIQYPGVAESVDSDMRTLARLLTASRLMPKSVDPEPMFKEVRQMLHQEVDYRRERHYTEIYARRLQDDTRFIVPAVVPEYCANAVLAMSYERGDDIHASSVQALSPATRNGLAAVMLELFVHEFFEWGTVQTDPNFGNYRFRIAANGDVRVVLLDFGATRSFSKSFVDHYAAIVRGALQQDREQVLAAALSLGVIEKDFPKLVLDALSDTCKTIVEPFERPGQAGARPTLWSADGYRWAASDLPTRVLATTAKTALTIHYQLPPREIVFLHRRLAGMFMMFAALRAEFDGSATLRGAVGLDTAPSR